MCLQDLFNPIFSPLVFQRCPTAARTWLSSGRDQPPSPSLALTEPRLLWTAPLMWRFTEAVLKVVHKGICIKTTVTVWLQAEIASPKKVKLLVTQDWLQNCSATYILVLLLQWREANINQRYMHKLFGLPHNHSSYTLLWKCNKIMTLEPSALTFRCWLFSKINLHWEIKVPVNTEVEVEVTIY